MDIKKHMSRQVEIKKKKKEKGIKCDVEGDLSSSRSRVLTSCRADSSSAIRWI